MNSNNKRIAKNTLMLYFRMMLIMAVTLYTSRVVLEVLGVEDFGIYNVVGGVVAMFGFLNSAMSSATQRFLSFELGRKDYEQLKKVFSLSVTIHALIAVVIFILAETIGLWFLNTQLTIPSERMEAANWVYQFSIFAFMVTVMAVPYNAAIVSRERMNVYAYVSIVEVILKLAIVFILQWFGFDKLKLYAVLMFVVSFIIRTIYQIYCKRKFEECNYRFVWDKKMVKDLTSFSGWNLFGGIAWMAMNQGQNIILNMFFGPTVNAARGVAFQINTAVTSLVLNFRTAVNPQIIKYSASAQNDSMIKLVFDSAKFSYYMMLILVLPLILQTEFVLSIWLKNIPDHSINFCRLVLIISLIQSFDASFGMIFQAIGRVKENQIICGMIYLLVLPISYIFLYFGFFAESVFYVQMTSVVIVAFVVKVILIKRLINISLSYYLSNLIVPTLVVSILACIFPIVANTYLIDGVAKFFIVTILCFVCCVISVYSAGISRLQRRVMHNYIKKKYNG